MKTYTEILDSAGRPTGSVDNGDVVIHWDGPGYYATQVSRAFCLGYFNLYFVGQS